MWPFKKKPLAEPVESNLSRCVRELKEFRDIGETFKYLGQTFIVTGHIDFIGYYEFVATLKADGVDKHGKVYRIQFPYRELKAVKAQNKPKKRRASK